MGSSAHERRLKRLEERANAASHAARQREAAEREKRIVRLIMDEYDDLEESGEDGDLLKKAVRNVVYDQYPEPELDHDYVAKGWLKTMRSWGDVEWMIKAGRERPDVPKRLPRPR